MKNIKAKIERVEKETKRIEDINNLIALCKNAHLKPVATFVNSGQVGREDDTVIIDENIMIKMLSEQIITIEREIEPDVKFIAAIELLASSNFNREVEEGKNAYHPSPIAPPQQAPQPCPFK